jgi:hypothetical protein
MAKLFMLLTMKPTTSPIQCSQHASTGEAKQREPSPTKDRRTGRGSRVPWTLLALLVPGVLFGVGLFLLRHDTRFAWLTYPSAYPWELWVIGVSGAIATTAGLADWRYHRSGAAAIGAREHRSELLALAGGGVPLFVLMSIASYLLRPGVLLLPVLVVVLFITVMICYDEFVFHRKRCGRYETILHRLLVFGNGIAWLAWTHWCFVRERSHG